MKIERRQSQDEKQILIGMIVNQNVLARVASFWKPGGLFRSKWSNIVGDWCVSYHKQYGKAPGPNMTSLYSSWAEDYEDTATVQLVERFLSSLSDQYSRLRKECNADYVLDVAGRHFNRVRLQKLSDQLQSALDIGKVEDAEKCLNQDTKIELGAGHAVNPLVEETVVRQAFEEKQEQIIWYPGALAQFFGGALSRGRFVALMAPEKRGKSYWLLDLAWRAMCQRRRVAFFEAGDMNQSEVIQRMSVRAARRPLAAEDTLYPIEISHDKEEYTATVEHEVRSYETDLSWNEAYAAFKKTQQGKVKSKQSYFRLACYPNDSLQVAGIRSTLMGWAREGWVADVVVIDYADILAAPPGYQQDFREGVNKNWKGLRALSQELRCLVLTATQTDAASYQTALLTKRNFSNDKRKYGHVTGMFGINATPEEQELELFRLNWLVNRHQKFSERSCVHTAACLAIGNPAVRSCW